MRAIQHRCACALAGATAVLLGSPLARAQCPGWLPTDDEGIPGPNSSVNASVAWDSDGDGPQPEWLVIGGDFDYVGLARVNNIAAWDGKAWRSLGGGTSTPVQTLVVHEGELYAGGGFVSAGGVVVNGITRWDGEQWQPLGAGVTGGAVRAMTSDGGGLYIAGTFTRVEGQLSAPVARWDGTAWNPMSATFTSPMNLRAIAVYNGELYVGGRFSALGSTGQFFDVARSDGAQWTRVGAGLRGEITSLAVHDGKLFAGGRVRLADTGATTFFGPVAAWDGVSWSRAGPDEFEDVHDVEVIGDSLYAAGGGRLVRLAEGAWELITPTTVNTIAAIGSSFVLGGAFQSIDDLPAARVAIRQGDTWDTLGYPVTNEFGGSISALKEIGGQLIAGGRFTSVGELPATGLARWDGLAWTPFGEMLQPSWIEFVSVKAIAEYEGDLIIGGSFVAPVELGTTPNIARWDGTQWHAIGDGLGTFTSLGVAALAVYRGDLYAVGDFAGSGDVIASGIARWNGSTWSRVVSAGSTGTGLSGFGVNALVVAHESLYIGGHGLGFAPPMAFGPQLTSIFRWDGTSYRFVPSSPSSVAGTISVLCTMGDDVIAGGSFTSIHGVPANSVARWDGSAWHPLGSGVLGAVYAAAEYNGSLIVAGSFDSAGGVTAENIASWDGNTWHPLGSGLTDGAFAIAMFNGELIVGGAFAGTGGLNSAYRARWSDGGVPWIASQPTDTTTCIDGIALLATASAAGYDGDDGLIFQWRHNGGLIADGPAGASPSGGEVSGAHLPTLVITGARLSDAGVYDCAISNSCGEVISAGATLTVLVGPCPWDLNTDGTVGVGDLGVLIGAWGAVAPPAPIALDLDESGTIDLADIAQVLTRWGALCE